MEVTSEHIEMLQKLQEVDRARLMAEKELQKLPYREKVIELRKRKKDVAEKLQKVEDMYAREERKIARIELEDNQLREKQQKTQEKIDSQSGDYRAVNTWTRDLQGMVKRRGTLEGQLSEAIEKLAEVDEVRRRAKEALQQLGAQEKQLVDRHNAESARLAQDIEKCLNAGKAIAQRLPRELLERYVAAVKRCGGVGLSYLQDNRCSACRSLIEDNRLLQVKRDAPLAECPNCHRILIVEG